MLILSQPSEHNLSYNYQGKATAATPCDSIEGPSVVLKDGSFIRLDSFEEAKKVIDNVESIIDLGEILIPFGEFVENNHPLQPSGWCNEWWDAILRSMKIEPYAGEFDFDSLLEFSKSKNVPLHPKFTYFWADLNTREVLDLRSQLIKDSLDVTRNKFKLMYKDIFQRLGLFYSIVDKTVFLKDGFEPLIRLLGLEA